MYYIKQKTLGYWLPEGTEPAHSGVPKGKKPPFREGLEKGTKVKGRWKESF